MMKKRDLRTDQLSKHGNVVPIGLDETKSNGTPAVGFSARKLSKVP